jgi:hypothetical protein
VRESKSVFKDYLVMRLWGRASEKTEICILSTRGHILSRHLKKHIRWGIRQKGLSLFSPIPGLRRYKTYKRADNKAQKMNKIFETKGFSAIREDEI